MRIVSGTLKGKRITAPKKLPVRPTTDMAKEALFNILNNRIDFFEISILDLFSGTGNIAYEFASRGTEEITAVDGHYGCVKFIQKTSEELELPIKTIKSDVVKYLSAIRTSHDVIFADPPYDFTIEQMREIIELVFSKEILAEDGMLIIEHTKHLDLSGERNFTEARKYGGSVFSFFG